MFPLTEISLNNTSYLACQFQDNTLTLFNVPEADLFDFDSEFTITPDNENFSFLIEQFSEKIELQSYVGFYGFQRNMIDDMENGKVFEQVAVAADTDNVAIAGNSIGIGVETGDNFFYLAFPNLYTRVDSYIESFLEDEMEENVLYKIHDTLSCALKQNTLSFISLSEDIDLDFSVSKVQARYLLKTIQRLPV